MCSFQARIIPGGMGAVTKDARPIRRLAIPDTREGKIYIKIANPQSWVKPNYRPSRARRINSALSLGRAGV